ncbi:energy transducer TonB [Sphingobium sp. DEHP117]|uniref:energy transducer TonB family protein n=1 Tax=Sphingobium sp. DEHP117 TaxID=2993436 RepID=UPI0027D6B615|nr:TonB family protein [Sphingobium sp. DEHP117]MDQ4420894.1 energy transducer TonB [Sphingobium sp. DEHP117]
MFKKYAGKVMVAAIVAAVATPAFAQPAAWQQAVARAIASKQTYPRAAQMRGDEGTVKVKVYVSATGAVEKTELVAPSGSSVLDREALALPTKVGTLPAPPGGAAAVVLPLTYKLM